MPRYRTISCAHCGFMQLKSDKECERCGRLTAREAKAQAFWVAKLVVTIIAAAGFYLFVTRSIAPSIGG